MKPKKNIRDEILDRAEVIRLNTGGVITSAGNDTYLASRISQNGRCSARKINFKSIEEAYAWIMEGKE